MFNLMSNLNQERKGVGGRKGALMFLNTHHLPDNVLSTFSCGLSFFLFFF